MRFKSLFLTIFFVSCSVNQANSANYSSFSLKSLDIKSNISTGPTISKRHVFNGFGCDGENISPQVNWVHPPFNTKSFAFSVYDPDAPTGSGWWHWLLVNIPATYSGLPRGFGGENKKALKDGILQIRNDFSEYKFGGPCPPKDTIHRYVFTVYALNTERLDIPENATAAFVGFMIYQNLIAKASFEGRYERK